MSEAPDEFRLEDIVLRHRIAAGLFIPFSTLRLRGDTDTSEAIWTITLRDIGTPGERRRLLRVRWSPENVPGRPPGVSDHTVTEWAALGMACMLLARYTSFHILRVPQPGSRFDYWITMGGEVIGLEVSGTQAGDLGIRHRMKVEQWRQNPHKVDGLVVAAAFGAREAILSFHRFPEELQ